MINLFVSAHLNRYWVGAPEVQGNSLVLTDIPDGHQETLRRYAHYLLIVLYKRSIATSILGEASGSGRTGNRAQKLRMRLYALRVDLRICAI